MPYPLDLFGNRRGQKRVRPFTLVARSRVNFPVIPQNQPLSQLGHVLGKRPVRSSRWANFRAVQFAGEVRRCRDIERYPYHIFSVAAGPYGTREDNPRPTDTQLSGPTATRFATPFGTRDAGVSRRRRCTRACS